VINDLDQTLKQLLIQKVPLDPTEVNIKFEAPDREWAASQSKPTINVYLYDMRENHELRSYEWNVERSHGTATRKKTPTRLDLSYLITVWTKDIADEHRLLGQITIALMRHPFLPEELFEGILKGLEYPVHTSTAQPDGLLKGPGDFWTALENKLKPSINYVVTLPVDLAIAVTAPIVSTKVLEVKEKDKDPVEEIVQIGGLVHGKTRKESGIANVSIILKELGVTAITDSSGHYTFPKVARGDYTLVISAPKQAAKEARVVVPSENYNIEI
jgi:hypothetical protein